MAASAADLCLQYPPCTVDIALTINAATTVTIEQGRQEPSTDADTDIGGCRFKFANGVTQDTWGKRCRNVSWKRQVPHGSYIRIRLCRAPEKEAGPLSTAALAGLPANALTKFQVNNQDLVKGIADVAAKEGGLLPTSCLVKAACIGDVADAPPDNVDAYCCQWYVTTSPATHTVVSWGDGTTDNLPANTEIVFGPIGQSLPF